MNAADPMTMLTVPVDHLPETDPDALYARVGQVRDAVLAGPTPLTSTPVQVPAAGLALARLHRIEGDAVIVIDVAPTRQ